MAAEAQKQMTEPAVKRYPVFICDSCDLVYQFNGWCHDCGKRLACVICSPIEEAAPGPEQNLELIRSLAAEMEEAANRADRDSSRPVATFDVRRWAGKLASLAP